MIRVIGWIAVVIIGVSAYFLMSLWSMQDEVVLKIMASFGRLVLSGFIAGLVSWFLDPILDKEDEA